jgi:hypothetical protein
MGDPVTMAVVGGSVGAMMNKKDPLKGAMLGAIGGYGGATLMPTLGAGTAAAGTTAAGTGSALTGAGASTGANTMFANAAGVNPGTVMGASQGAGYTSAAIPSNIFSTPSAVNTAMTPAVERPLTYGMQGVEYGQGGSPTMMERFGQVGQFAQQNPVLSQMAMQGAQSLLQQQPQQPAPAGIMRGSPSQVQMPQYQVGVPKVSLI